MAVNFSLQLLSYIAIIDALLYLLLVCAFSCSHDLVSIINNSCLFCCAITCAHDCFIATIILSPKVATSTATCAVVHSIHLLLTGSMLPIFTSSYILKWVLYTCHVFVTTLSVISGGRIASSGGRELSGLN